MNGYKNGPRTIGNGGGPLRGVNFRLAKLNPQVVIDGEILSISIHPKTCDNFRFCSENYLARYCKYPISDKNAKKRKTAGTILPLITCKCNLVIFGHGGDTLKKL